MNVMAWMFVGVAVAVAAGKKDMKKDIPQDLQEGMIGEVRSLDIAVEAECEAHLQREQQWRIIGQWPVMVDFVKYRFGYQIVWLSGHPEAVKALQAAAEQMAKDQQALVDSTEKTVCKNCAQMKMMGELGNYAMEAVKLKQGAMILVVSGIEKLVPEIQRYGQEEFQWMRDRVKPPAAPVKK